jgi:hypothetical protein
MPTLKSSSTHAKSGERQKGIAHFESMIVLEKSKEKPDTLVIRRYESIIKCLKDRIENEKKK